MNKSTTNWTLSLEHLVDTPVGHLRDALERFEHHHRLSGRSHILSGIVSVTDYVAKTDSEGYEISFEIQLTNNELISVKIVFINDKRYSLTATRNNRRSNQYEINFSSLSQSGPEIIYNNVEESLRGMVSYHCGLSGEYKIIRFEHTIYNRAEDSVTMGIRYGDGSETNVEIDCHKFLDTYSSFSLDCEKFTINDITMKHIAGKGLVLKISTQVAEPYHAECITFDLKSNVN